MEADLFMYSTGIYSDGDSGSEFSETTASASVVSALSSVTTKTPRKFGTELTKSSLGNRNQNSRSTKKPSSRFAKKLSAAKKNKSAKKVLSPHYEEKGVSSSGNKSSYSRFSSKPRSKTARNLEGSLEKAEESVRSALAANKDSDGGKIPEAGNKSNNKSSPNDQSNKIAHDRRASVKSPLVPLKNVVEYNVEFEPGPIGLKLEPVMINGKNEFGCRVMKFVEKGTNSSPSQASKSGKINVGDVLTAVNGENVTSKSYQDIVSILKAAALEPQGRRITFRVPRSPAAVMPKTPVSKLMKSSPSASKTSTPIDTKRGESNEAGFSPSSVKKMAEPSANDSSDLEASKVAPSQPLSNILNTVMKNIAPAKITKSSNESSIPTKQNGQEPNDVDETAHKKLELLTELSEAKISLGEQEKNMKMMTKIMEDIQKEKIAAQAEKESIKGEMSEVQKAKNLSESMLKEKDEQINMVSRKKENELKMAQCQIEETTARVNTLAKQNGVLRAENEQLKVQFNLREQEFKRQMNASQKELMKENHSSTVLKEKIQNIEGTIADKDRELSVVSNNLQDTVQLSQKALKEVDSKNAELVELRDELKRLKTNSEEIESSNKATIVSLQSQLRTLSEELDRMSTESQELHQENARAHSLIEDSSSEANSLKTKLKDAEEHYQTALREALSDHKEQIEKHEKDRENLLKQLSDSKKIIESTTTELHNNRLVAVEKEVKQRENSEQQLLTKINDLNAENKNLRQQLEHSLSKTKIVENNLDQIQKCLFEATEKSNHLGSELEQAQKINEDLQSQHKALSVEMKNSKNEIQALTSVNERLNTEYHTVQTSSQTLRLQLSELERLMENKVSHLNQLNSAQNTEFDQERMKLEEQITDSNALIQNLMAKVEANSNENFEAHEQKIAKMLKDSAAMELEMKNLQIETVNLQDLLSACEKERSALAADNEGLAERVDQAESTSKRWMETSRLASVDVANIKKAEEEARLLSVKLQETVDDLVVQRDALVVKVNDISTQRVNEKSNLEAELKELQDELSRAQNAANESNLDDGALMRQILDLEDKLRVVSADLNEQKIHASTQLSEQSDRHQESLSKVRMSFVESVQEKESFIEKLQAEIEEKQDEIHDLSCKRDDLHVELEKSRNEHILRINELDVSKCEVDQLRKQLHIVEEDARSNKLEYSEALEQLQEELKTAKLEIGQQKIKNDAIISQNSACNKNRIDELQKLFSQSVKEKEEFIEKLQEDLEQKQISIDALVSENHSAVEEKDSLALQLCQAESHLKNMKNELQASEREAIKQRDELQNIEQNSHNRIEQLQIMFKASISEKEIFIEKLQKDIEVKQDKIDTITHNQTAISDKTLAQLAESQSNCENLQRELDTTKVELGSLHDEYNRQLLESQTESERMQLHYSSQICEKDAQLELSKSKLQDIERDLSGANQSLCEELKNCQQEIATMRKDHKSIIDSCEQKREELSKEIKEKVKANEGLVRAMEDLEKSQGILSGSVAEKDLSILQLKNTIKENQITIDKLIEEKSEIFAKSESLSILYADAQTTIERMSKDASDKMKTLNGKIKELDDANEQINSLQESVLLSQVKAKELSSQIVTLEENLSLTENKHSKSCESYQQNLEAMKLEIDAKKADHAQELAELRSSHGKEKEEFSLSLDEANKVIISCKGELVTVKEALAQREHSFSTLQIDFESKIDKLSSATQEKEGEIKKLQEFSASLRKSVDEEISKNEGLTKEINQFQIKLETNHHKNVELKEKLRKSESNAVENWEKLRSLTADLVIACRDLKLKTNVSMESYENSEDVASDLIRVLREAVNDNQSNAMAGLELANSRERAVFRLERTLAAKDRDIKGLQENMAKLKFSFSEIKNNQILAESEKSEFKLKIDSLEKEKAEIKNAYLSSDNMVKSLRTENSEYKIQIETLSTNVKKFEAEIESSKTLINEYEVKMIILSHAQEQLDTQSKLIETLQSDVEDVSCEAESLITKNESLEKLMLEAQKKIEILESSELSARAKCSEVSKELESSVNEAESLESRNCLLYNENVSLVEKVGDCEATIEHLKLEMSSKEDAILKDRAAYESNAKAQKRIATVLEKHLRMKSDELRKQEAVKNADIEALRKEVETKLEDNKVLVGKVTELESQLKTESIEKRDVRRILEERKAEFEEASQKIESLKQEQRELQDQILDLEGDKKGLEGSLADTMTKLERKDDLISQLNELITALEQNGDALQAALDQRNADLDKKSKEIEELRNEESQHFDSYSELLEKIEVKSIEIDDLNKQIGRYKSELSTSHKKLEKTLQQLDSERKKYDEKIDEIEDAHQDTKARLFGAEKLSLIHDQECTRLLNDIETKSEQITSLTETVATFESDRDEANSKMNELEASIVTQKEIISALEDEISKRIRELEDIESDDAQHNANLNALNEQIRSLEVRLEDKETEMETLLSQSKDDAIKMADLQSRLNASEEETKLLCEAIEEKDSEIFNMHNIVEGIKKEKAETLSHLALLQEKVKKESQESSSVHLDFLHDDDGISLGISRPSLSPTASDIVQKHNDLLNDLVKMKSTIYDAVSPSKSMNSSTTCDDEGDGGFVGMLQEELKEKNSILTEMGIQVDSLMEDIAESERLLKEKEKSTEELTESIKDLQHEKSELKKKLKSRKSYIKQLEDALSHEVKHRRDTEETLNNVMKEKKTLVTEFRTKSQELSRAEKKVEEKSHAVEEQMRVARNLAKQLQTTKQKIFALKQHLQKEGLLKDGNLSSMPHISPLLDKTKQEYANVPDINAAMSNDSINWNISEDDYST